MTTVKDVIAAIAFRREAVENLTTVLKNLAEESAAHKVRDVIDGNAHSDYGKPTKMVVDSITAQVDWRGVSILYRGKAIGKHGNVTKVVAQKRVVLAVI